MLKFLIIVLLVGFLIFKVLGLFFRVLLGGSATERNNGRNYRNQQYQSSGKHKDGNINIDYVPGNGQAKKPKNFKGGEYVDYEEVE